MLFLRYTMVYLLLMHCSMVVHAQHLIDQVVLTVNGEPITASEVDNRFALLKKHQPTVGDADKSQILKGLIIETLMLQIAQTSNLGLDSAAVDQIATELLQQGELPVELARDVNQLKRAIVLNMMPQKLLSDFDLSITDEDLLTQVSIPSLTETVRFHIETLSIPMTPTSSVPGIKPLWSLLKWPYGVKQLPTKTTLPSANERVYKEATQALSRAKQGISLLELAREPKRKGRWKAKDMDLPADKLPSVYVDALMYLNPGEVAGPFQLSNALHLVRLKKASGPNIVHVRQIVLTVPKGEDEASSQQRLLDIRQHCLDGEDFVQQAKRYSEDPHTALKGGDLGWLLHGSQDPIFDAQVASLEPGQISLPFKNAAGWHIVQLLERQWLTQNHPKKAKYIAPQSLKEKKAVEKLKEIEEELYAAARIIWVDDTLNVAR